MAFNLPTPTSMSNMFGKWLDGVESNNKARIRGESLHIVLGYMELSG